MQIIPQNATDIRQVGVITNDQRRDSTFGTGFRTWV